MLSFKTQLRGGKGVKGMTTKEEDSIAYIRYAQTHDNFLFFTNKGKAYQLRAYDIPESSRTSKGTAIVNLLDIDATERVESFVNYRSLKSKEGEKEETKFVFLTTKKGTVKKSPLSEFENIRKSGIVAIKLDKDDELVWSNLSKGDDDILIFTRNGKAVRFSEKSARPLGRSTMGVRGIKLTKDDEVVGMDVIAKNDKADLLIIMDNGLGKKSSVTQFRRQSRGGQGIKAANVTPKTGKVAVAQVIPANCQEAIMTSKRGLVVKLSLDSIPRLSRATQGVILMRFTNPNDHVASATCIEVE